MPNLADYYFFKSMGLCGQCGKAKQVPGMARCASCLAKQRQRNKRLRENGYYKAYRQKAKEAKAWAKAETS